MNNDLEERLAAWRRRTAETELAQLEPQVWARIGKEARPSAAGLLGFRAALAAAMLAIGVVAGGAASATAEPEVSPFAVHAAYAPSTLLEGGQ